MRGDNLMATTIQDLEERLNTFEKSLIQMAQNNTPLVTKVDDTSNKVEQITPYTETKTAYIDDTEVVFTNVPEGNLTIYFSKPYTVVRDEDRLLISFEALEEVTQITISII